MNIDTVPSDLDNAIELILEAMEDSQKEEIKKFGFHPMHHHHGIGIWIRNNWSLWEKDTPLVRWFNSRGIHHPDDMSCIITESVERTIKGEDVNFEKQVESLREYWRSHSVDPDNLEEIS